MGERLVDIFDEFIQSLNFRLIGKFFLNILQESKLVIYIGCDFILKRFLDLLSLLFDILVTICFDEFMNILNEVTDTKIFPHFDSILAKRVQTQLLNLTDQFIQ